MPAVSPDRLRLRAGLLQRIRAFFADRGVLEVETPVLSRAAATDPALHSFSTGYRGPGLPDDTTFYLHTSPEYPMKRLLAAGSGSIYQLAKVFRDGEAGRLHNPEFTLLEWYRTGFDHLDLMDEVEKLLVSVLAEHLDVACVDHWTYRELFSEFVGIDPFSMPLDDIRRRITKGHAVETAGMPDERDAWLDLAMTHLVEPRLGRGLVFVRDYPESQASLARVRATTPPVASRFEVYLDGIELANGFHELADAGQQRRRFENENLLREKRGMPRVPLDENLLAAMAQGLPDCAGVALGFDRLVMLAAGADSLRDVMPFPVDIA
jgi:lysyl-tRNA synthetase class 2